MKFREGYNFWKKKNDQNYFSAQSGIIRHYQGMYYYYYTTRLFLLPRKIRPNWSQNQHKYKKKKCPYRMNAYFGADIFIFFSFFCIITSTFQLNSLEVFTLRGLLDKPWSQVPSPSSAPRYVLSFLSRTSGAFRWINFHARWKKSLHEHGKTRTHTNNWAP